MTILSEIANGTATLAEAREFLDPYIRSKSVGENPTIVTAFRRLIWGVVDEKRRDGELRAWANIIHSLAVACEEGAEVRGKLTILAELADHSIAISESRPIDWVLERKNVREAIGAIRSSVSVRRTSLREKLGLQEANMTRLQKLLIEAGLVDTKRIGRELYFALTRLGMEVTDDLSLPQSDSRPRDTINSDDDSIHHSRRVLAEPDNDNSESVGIDRIGKTNVLGNGAAA